MIHELKTVSPYFDAVYDGIKTFEIRTNDRDFKYGDTVILKEYDADKNAYSGRVVSAKVGFITDFEQKDGYVVFSLMDIKTGWHE